MSQAYETRVPFRSKADPFVKLQLGIFFFIAALFALWIGIYTFFNTSSQMMRRMGLVSVGKATQAVALGIGLLTIGSCLVLIIAKV